MGHACCQSDVFLFLSAFETILKTEGIKVKPGALSAAAEVYDEK
jgi:aspartate aminotransferase-like enzyme